MTSLAERLGYGPDDKLLIVNCDDLGSSASANRAIGQAVDAGAATSATLMVPCPWALDGAAKAKAGGIGVHLTLTCEYPAYRWRALTGARSLHDGQGYMRSATWAVWDDALLDEVRAECVAQIEQAYAWGVDVTHLDTHMGTMQLEARFYAIMLELAARYRLPIRMIGAKAEEVAGFPARALAAEGGILHADYTIDLWRRPPETLANRLQDLRPGVTELFLHPVEDGPELRGYDLKADEADIRARDHATLSSPAFLEMVEAAGAKLISFAPLRDLQRAA